MLLAAQVASLTREKRTILGNDKNNGGSSYLAIPAKKWTPEAKAMIYFKIPL